MDARDILDIHPVYEIDWMTAFGRVVGKTCLSFSEEVILSCNLNGQGTNMNTVLVVGGEHSRWRG